jgi:hypothetical protein
MPGQPLILLYSEMPSALAPNGPLFCLFSESAARKSVQAHEATTWGQLAEAIDLPLDRIADPTGEWAGEIAEAFGRIPRPGDTFRLPDYWGRRCFAGLVVPPCQAAVLAVLDRPMLKRLLTDVGFEFAFGAPGSDGDAIVFRDRGMIRQLEQEIVRRGLKDQIGVHQAAPHELAHAMGLD